MLSIPIPHAFLALLCLASLAGLLFARPAPNQMAYDTCKNIGIGSGCSGCQASNVDCEWCTSPSNDAAAICAPQGFCHTYLDPSTNQKFVPNPHLCQADPRSERMYSGKNLGDESKDESSRFSPHFDPHYCDFPELPWAVDRSSNPYGNRDPTANCLRVNNRLAVGQRAAIDACLANSGGNDKKRAFSSSVMTEKRKECLRVLQSYLCTFNCPEYGVAMDFTRLCSNYCERLYQHCDEDILACVKQNGMPDFPFEDCAPKDDLACSRPALIPPHGHYEYDLCFYGDPKRCASVDCQVTLSSDPYPESFTNVPDFTNGVNYVQGSSGPYCCYHDDAPSYAGYGCHGFMFEITTAPTGLGKSCEAVVDELVADTWKDQLEWTYGFPICDGNQVGNHCAAAAYITSGPVPHPGHCLTADRNYDCPALFYKI